MISVVKGDILNSDCDVIIHQANCYGVMGGGVAKKIKKKYPESFIVDKNFKYPVGDKRRLGGFSHTPFDRELIIFNMYSQFNYGGGKLTDYNAFRKAFTLILLTLKENDKDKLKIGLPYGIGCGKAGGDWKIVEKILKDVSEEQEVTIYLYRLEKFSERLIKKVRKK